MSGREVTLFYSYSHEDENLQLELRKHLRILDRQGVLKGWSDRDISAGSEWRGQIDQHLESADIILLLISPDFIASDYCYDVELALALRRHNNHECVVVPVFLREVDVSGAPFAELQGLPRDARPIASWSDHDAAFAEVARGIRQIALTLSGTHGSLSNPAAQEPTSASGHVPADVVAEARDIQRIAKYWNLFDRPAFSFPCIFEHAIEGVSDACEQILSAMLTGRLTIRQYMGERTNLDIPSKNSFETELFLSTLTQVRNLISNLRRTVSYLRDHLSHTDGSPPEQSYQSADNIRHMEFYLVDLIRGGASPQFVRMAFAIMDKIDSERNAIIELMNSLFRLSSLRQLPSITLSSQLLELSEHMRQYSWDEFYLRTHAELRSFLESDKGNHAH